MALAECSTITDQSGRELAEHGTPAFPVACYHDDFRKMDVPWHWHEELEAALVTEGSCVVAAGNEKYVLHAGEGFFVNSEILHGCWDIEHTGCRFHSLVFHPRLVGGSLDSVFQQRFVEPLVNNPGLETVPLRPSLPWQADALKAIECAWQQCSCEPEGFEFRTRASLSELIYLLYSHMPSRQPECSARTLRDGERIKTMLAYIHSNYSGTLSARSIATSAMISESECLRCFRATIGTTPIRYVKQYRIRQAAKQLLATGDRVSEIAAQCGFQDMSYFTKTFRELQGCTPTEYREHVK